MLDGNIGGGRRRCRSAPAPAAPTTLATLAAASAAEHRRPFVRRLILLLVFPVLPLLRRRRRGGRRCSRAALGDPGAVRLVICEPREAKRSWVKEKMKGRKAHATPRAAPVLASRDFRRVALATELGFELAARPRQKGERSEGPGSAEHDQLLLLSLSNSAAAAPVVIPGAAAHPAVV